MRKSEYPTEVKTMGQRIRKIRMDKGLSLQEVAKMVGITESYLSRLEASKQKPSIQISKNIATALKDINFDLYVSWSMSVDLKEFKEFIKKEALNMPQHSKLIQTIKIIQRLKTEVLSLPSSKQKQTILDLASQGEKLLKDHCVTNLGLEKVMKDL